MVSGDRHRNGGFWVLEVPHCRLSILYHKRGTRRGEIQGQDGGGYGKLNNEFGDLPNSEFGDLPNSDFRVYRMLAATWVSEHIKLQ